MNNPARPADRQVQTIIFRVSSSQGPNERAVERGLDKPPRSRVRYEGMVASWLTEGLEVFDGHKLGL